MNSLDDLSKRQSDNMPVFFTGLAESVNNEPKKPLLCIFCRNSTANNTNIKNDSLESKDNYDGCENCTKHFNNLKEALILLSKNSSFSLTLSPETSSSQYPNVNSYKPIEKRKFLLPHPDQPSYLQDQPSYLQVQTSCLPDQPSTSNNANFTPSLDISPTCINIKEEDAFTPDYVTDLKRKNDFPEHNSKRFRPGFSPKVKTYRRSRGQTSPENSYEELSKSIWQLYVNNKQSESVYQSKMTLRDKLHEILLTTFPKCGLYVVGSSMTGLGGNSSDMDMCLMLTDAEIDQEKEATRILQTVHSLFLECSFLTEVQIIYAKVPILRFVDRVSGIEIDLNVNNSVGIRNTQLLSSYARVDKRLPPLVLLVKMWAQFNGINDAKNNTLSSYSLVLMVIHYLQYACRPPVLPCLQKLQPDKYQPNCSVRKLKLLEDLPSFTSENKKNLGDLFVGFLNYFANEFDYFRSVMSVRLGGILPKEVAMNRNSPKNKKGHWKWVCIEEPFDLTNTACAVFKPEVFRYMRQVFESSWERLRRTADLSSIMN